jgi:hypothetical protein
LFSLDRWRIALSDEKRSEEAQILRERSEAMNDVANKKPMPARSDVARQRGGFDWSHALVEIATVVIGILIALAVNNWAQART